MKVDGGIAPNLERVAEAAATVERRGYDAAWCGEVNHDPFLPLVLAAEHTSTVQVGTCIAVAFARSPMTVAYKSWDLQAFSKGRFVLGLGSQIRPHIEKRYSMPWGKPVRRMREFIEALRAIWSCWQDGTKLSFEGEFYSHKLMTPMFMPEPQAYGPPKVFLAAVGEAMTELGGEVADGLHAHAFTTERYLKEVTIPTLLRGIERSGRRRQDVEVACPLFVVTGEGDEEMETAAQSVRRQLAFYGSTPAYRNVLELHGWGDLQTELHALSLRGEWEAMGRLIDDDMLDTFAVVAPVRQLAAKIRDRFDGVVDRVMFGLPAGVSEETGAAVLEEMRA